MRKYAAQLCIAAVAFIGGLFVATTVTSVQSQTQSGSGFAAVPGARPDLLVGKPPAARR